MTIRQMTPSEIDTHGTYGTKRDLIVDGYTDDIGGVVLLHARHEVRTDGKMPTYLVRERRLFQVVLAGEVHSLNTFSDDLRSDMRELSKALASRISGFSTVSAADGFTSHRFLSVRSSQTIRGTKKNTVFGLPEQQMAEILPLTCEVILRAARREVAADRKKAVDREVQMLLNHIGHHLWKEAEQAINYKERYTALLDERRGAFEAAKLALSANAREELSELEIKDEEVFQAVVAGLEGLKRPAHTLELT